MDIDPLTLAARIGRELDPIRAGDYGFQFTDRYGVTYHGPEGHVTLAALARPDITPFGDLPPHLVESLRDAVRLVTYWISNPATPMKHVHAWRTVTRWDVCRAVVYARLHYSGSRDTGVGKVTLPLHLDNLLAVAAGHGEAAPPPAVADRNGTWLGEQQPLPITALAADGGSEVDLRLHVQADERISWDFTTTVSFPTERMHELATGDLTLADYLPDNRELIEHHLEYGASYLDDGLNVRAEILGVSALTESEPQQSVEEPVEEPRRVTVTLFYVGTSREQALTTEPWLDPDAARALAQKNPALTVYRVAVGFDAASLIA